MTSAATDVRRLRRLTVGTSLRRYPDLAQAVAAMGFVQYDPIRRPARAQDLILFQRVKLYRSGDLDGYYPSSGLEEDYLYAYGAICEPLAALLQPRPDRQRPDRSYRPRGLSAEVLAFVRQQGLTRPQAVATALGRSQATNDWGGISAATTRSLEELHYHGLLRVAKRVNGVKAYEPSPQSDPGLSANKRLRLLTLAMVRSLAPVTEAGLRRAIGQLCAASGGLEGRGTVIADLLAAGDMEYRDVGGVRHYAPAGVFAIDLEEIGPQVRFLAPFDPVVWDRWRFEHLWGWDYRFEAYTPKRRRRFGYYALPMFWRENAVGWVNLTVSDTGQLDVENGFAKRPLRGRVFQRAFEREVDRFEAMLAPRTPQDEKVNKCTKRRPRA